MGDEMGPMQIELLVEIAIEGVLYSLLLFAIVAFVVGLMLFVAPHQLERLRAISDRWITLRKLLKPLEIPRESDPFLYRHHQWVGAITTLLSLATLYLLLYGITERLPDVSIPDQRYSPFWQWLYANVILFLWIGSIFTCVAGVTIFFRPSLLKQVEGITNRWISTRQRFRWIDQYWPHLDVLMLSRGRRIGIFLILGSLYILMLIGTLMLQQPDWLELLVNQLYKG